MDPEQTLKDLEIAIDADMIGDAAGLVDEYVDWRTKKEGFEPENGDKRFVELVGRLHDQLDRRVRWCRNMLPAFRKGQEASTSPYDVVDTRTAIFQQLEKLGVQFVFMSYSGGNDEGDIDESYQVKPPIVLSDDFFTEIADYCEEVLNEKAPYWCAGRGARGDIDIDVEKRTITFDGLDGGPITLQA